MTRTHTQAKDAALNASVKKSTQTQEHPMCLHCTSVTDSEKADEVCVALVYFSQVTTSSWATSSHSPDETQWH